MGQRADGLLHLIEEDKLVKIIEAFTKATDITIDINDADGLPVVEHDFFYGFCRSIRSTEAGLQRCIESNARLGLQTMEPGGSCVGKCHAGVILMSVPILVEGQFYGSITCGQMHLQRPGEQEIAEMLEATQDLGLDPEYLKQTFQEIRVIGFEKSQGAVGLIQFVVNYIVELMVRAKMLEELSREKLKAAEDARMIVELEHTLQKAELKNLQAQIKPHFLFNTLNTISSLVMLGETEEGLNTLFALSDLLRHNVDRPGELVTLREELHYIESYLLIQQKRFGSRLKVSVEVPEELQEKVIPFLSLQPLVENACIHGLEPKEGEGHIWIRGEKFDDHIELAVIDDGIGMPLPPWTGGVEEQKPGGQGIGLRNVQRRLQLQFGPQSGVRWLSMPDKTVVKLVLPLGE